MSSPFFSIIILAWNVEKYIGDCLNSVRDQAFSDFEVLVLAETEDRFVKTICAKLDDPRFRVIHMANQGQLLNRLYGVKAAAGEYILFLDGDDSWRPELLESVRAAVMQTNADTVLFGYEKDFEDGTAEDYSHILPDRSVYTGLCKEPYYEKLLEGTKLNASWDKAIRRDVLLSVHDELISYGDMRLFEDLVSNLYITDRCACITYLTQALYRYRIRGGSMMRSEHSEEIADYFRAKKTALYFAARWSLDDPPRMNSLYLAVARYTADWIFRCATASFSSDDKKRLRSEILSDHELWPQIRPFLRHAPMDTKHRLFIHLFRLSSSAWLAYGKLYKTLKTLLSA